MVGERGRARPCMSGHLEMVKGSAEAAELILPLISWAKSLDISWAESFERIYNISIIASPFAPQCPQYLEG